MITRLVGPMQGWAVLCVGTAVSLWAGWGQFSRWTTAQQTNQHVQTYQAQSAIGDKIEEQMTLLQSAAGLFAASDSVEPAEWQTFAESMNSVEHASGAASMGYILAEASAEHGWRLVPAQLPGQPAMPELTQAIDDPAMRLAMRQSADADHPVMSGPMRAKDPLTHQPMYAILMPIRAKNHKPSAQPTGWVATFTSPRRVVDMAAPFLSDRNVLDNLLIYDGTDPQKSDCVYGKPVLANGQEQAASVHPSDRQTLMLADRPFTLYWTHPPLQLDRAVIASAGAVLTVGLLMTLMLHALVRSLYKTRNEMEHGALHDELTGLPNRVLLKQRLDEAMVRVRDDPDYRIAVLFLDFDHFKVINDSLGHHYGDQLLQQVAGRLHANLRTGGSATRQHADMPARLGGDEFVVLMETREAEVDAVSVADRLGKALAEPYDLMGQEVVSSASIGIVIPDTEHTCAEDVLRDADLAMYHAKEQGRARYALFDTEMREKAVRRLNLEKAMRHAVALEQFHLMYQPIVCLESGRIMGFEALVRWHHPQHGLVNPDEFITVAEETGLIVEIGYWVLQTACRQLAAWRKTIGDQLPLFMNVNVSRREMTAPGFINRVEQTLAWFDLPPGSVKLEITESAIMSHFQELTPLMQQLRELGIPLCMDDFGTGHSSLSCLHTFPIDVLKIDRAFIRNMGQAIDYTAIVQAVVTLAHTLKMTVVAEGIETNEHLAQLQALETDLAQGYYFARPMSADQAEHWMKSRIDTSPVLADHNG